MKEKNFLEDFRLALRLYACTMGGEQKEEIGFPDYDFRAVFYTDGNKANAYTASCIGGKCTNCFNDNGRVCVVFNNHRLGLGVLNVEFTAYIPDGYYPDGDQRSVVPAPLDVKLVRRATPCPKDIEVDLMLPYIQFRFKDLTDAEKAELMRPATEAAQRADEAVTKAETATAEAVKSNQELAKNVAEAEKSEQQRQAAEAERAVSEARRSEAEAGRVDAEAARVLAESGRKDAENTRRDNEQVRINGENRRGTGEHSRQIAETARNQEEGKRAASERQRGLDEATRVNQEESRRLAEDDRRLKESNRAGAEAGRVAAENKRKEAETLRQSQEESRAQEFAGWKDTIDGKVGRKEYTEGMAGKLDKSVWDGYNAQFENIGLLNNKGESGGETTYCNSGLLPFDKSKPIEVDLNSSSLVNTVQFFDTSKNFMAGILGPQKRIISPNEFPAAAVFVAFVTTSYSATRGAYYRQTYTAEGVGKAVTDAISASKYALFIDQWNAAWGAYGKYDPVNAPDALHPFYGNTLWMTYEEAMLIMVNVQRAPCNVFVSKDARTYLRTNLFVATGVSSHDNSMTANGVFDGLVNTEVLNVDNMYTGNFSTKFKGINIFKNCRKLHTILGEFRMVSGDTQFANCTNLKDFNLYELAYALNLSNSPLLSVETITFMVANAVNDTLITITVHPDVYAKLTGDTSNAAAAALDAAELAQWQQVCADAAAKNISFATV